MRGVVTGLVFMALMVFGGWLVFTGPLSDPPDTTGFSPFVVLVVSGLVAGWIFENWPEE